MAGRNDRAIADALQALAQAVGNQTRNESRGAAEYQGLDLFQRNNPPSFSGGYNPDKAQTWLRELEKIFRVMACAENQKVLFATYMLTGEAEYWWENTRQYLEINHQIPTWETFKGIFLEKYFPEDVKNRKEMEFLELKQGNQTVAEYSAKFEELVRYFPHYQGREGESSKCVKYLNGLRPEIKQAINYQGIRQFPQLVNMCRIYDEDSRERAAYYKVSNSFGPMKTKRSFSQNQGKPYPHRSDGKDLNKNYVVPRFASGSNSNPLPGPINCYRCGKVGHIAPSCPDKEVTCYGCRQKGHIHKNCPYVKKEINNKTQKDR